MALHALAELRDLVEEHADSRELVELQTMGIWELKLPTFGKGVLSVLFDRFASIRESFDYRVTQRELCTLENLAELTRTCGARRVTRVFQRFLESRAFQEWAILIPLENVRVRVGAEGVGGTPIQLRPLTSEEREQLKVFLQADRLSGLFFSASVEAGDAGSAVAKTRRSVDIFLAPYYLHRVRNPDSWWRARTLRQIVSPVAFYSNPQGLFGASRELRELPTEVSDLFSPDPGIEPKWKGAVEELAASWSQSGFPGDPIGERLRLCSRWMFSAESDDIPNNAFLKHAIAWEALMPRGAERLIRCWYLLLLCLGASDPLCVETISQASRLVDRRNSFAHPELGRELYGTVESDLTRLKQCLWWGFDAALRLWQSPGGRTLDWPRLLSDCYAAIRSGSRPRDYDAPILGTLDCLGYVERDDGGEVALSPAGQRLLVEAHITRARQLWPDDRSPKESVGALARALQAATEEALPLHEYHVLLTIEERSRTMDTAAFEDGWRLAGVTTTCPTLTAVTQHLSDIARDFGITHEAVGWKK